MSTKFSHSISDLKEKEITADIQKQILTGEITFFIRRQIKKKYGITNTTFRELFRQSRINIRKALLLRAIVMLLIGAPLVFAVVPAYSAGHILWITVLLVVIYLYLLLTFLVHCLMSYLID